MIDIKNGNGISMRFKLTDSAGTEIQLRDSSWTKVRLIDSSNVATIITAAGYDENTNVVFARISAEMLSVNGNYKVSVNVQDTAGNVLSNTVADLIKVSADGADVYQNLTMDMVMTAVEVPDSAQATGASPKIGTNGNWLVYNDTLLAYEDTGVSATPSQAVLDTKVDKDGDKVLTDNNLSDSLKGTYDGYSSLITDLQNNKVDKDGTKVLSDKNFTTAEKTKLDDIDMATKQDALVSGTNIKTLNGTSLLGSGDIAVATAAELAAATQIPQYERYGFDKSVDNASLYNYTLSATSKMALYDADSVPTGKVSKIIYYTAFTAAATIYIGIYDRVYADGTYSYLCSAVVTKSVAIGDTEIDLSGDNLTINANQRIGISNNNVLFRINAGVGITADAYKNAFVGQTMSKAADNISRMNVAYEIVSYDTITSIADEVENNLDLHKVDIDNMATLMMLGSSFTDTAYQPMGSSWVPRMNDISDISIVNNGKSGGNLITNLSSIINGGFLVRDTSNTAYKLSPKFIWFGNSANGTPGGETGIAQLKVALEVTQQMGAKMLLATEGSTTGVDGNILMKCYGQFAKKHGLPYSIIMPTYAKMLAYKAYAGTMGGGGHNAYRTSGAYMAHLDLINAIHLYKNVKMFHVRPKSADNEITALCYDNNMQRLLNWYACDSGEGGSTEIKHMDNLDNSSYDITEGGNVGTNLSEISMMQRGADITFNKKCVVEFILDRIKITKGVFAINCDVEPTAIYVAKTKSASTTYDGSTRSTWDAVTVVYDSTNKIATVNLSDRADIQLYDKVRFMIVSTGDMALSKPSFYSYDGMPKLEDNDINYHVRETGTECNDKTSCESGWNVATGVSVKSFPTSMANYTSYNSVKSHLQFDTADVVASKAITIPSGAKRLAIRIVAQRFIPYMTTRFVGTDDANSEYVSTVPVYENYDYDYSTLHVNIDDSSISDELVYQGWHEIYFEYEIVGGQTSLTLKLSKTGSDTAPILIHDVSIQQIK